MAEDDDLIPLDDDDLDDDDFVALDDDLLEVTDDPAPKKKEKDPPPPPPKKKQAKKKNEVKIADKPKPRAAPEKAPVKKKEPSKPAPRAERPESRPPVAQVGPGPQTVSEDEARDAVAAASDLADELKDASWLGVYLDKQRELAGGAMSDGRHDEADLLGREVMILAEAFRQLRRLDEDRRQRAEKSAQSAREQLLNEIQSIVDNSLAGLLPDITAEIEEKLQAAVEESRSTIDLVEQATQDMAVAVREDVSSLRETVEEINTAVEGLDEVRAMTERTEKFARGELERFSRELGKSQSRSSQSIADLKADLARVRGFTEEEIERINQGLQDANRRISETGSESSIRKAVQKEPEEEEEEEEFEL